MSEPYIGQILAVGFNFAPVNWALCNGALISISENSTLFNLIGTTYGGDGVSTFALPDLRGRTAINQGTGSGLPPYVMGQSGGTETVTVNTAQTPSHNHTLNTSSKAATTGTPGSTVALASVTAPTPYTPPIVAPAPQALSLLPASIGPSAGGSLPHENRQPFLTINYIIALYGLYPPQN